MIQLACLVCKHVLEDVSETGFICHSGFGWSAGCSERCLDESSEKDLGMIHLGSVLASDRVDNSVRYLPKGFASVRTKGIWEERYFHDEYHATDGDFVAPPKGDTELNRSSDQVIFAYRQSKSSVTEVVWIKMDEGTVCIPFWDNSKDAEHLKSYLSGDELLFTTTFGELSSYADGKEVRYLAPNFLVRRYDYAILAR